MGSSRYATGAPSRRITPWRLGFGRAASAFEALADADSVRSGLKRLRLAMVPSAPPDRSVAVGAAAVDATGALDARRRSEERRVGKSVDLGGRRMMKKKGGV